MRLCLLDMNEKIRDECVVPAHYEGQRIDAVLAELFPQYSRSLLSSWLKQGIITIDRRLMKPKEKVHGGEEVIIHQKDIERETFNDIAEPIPLSIMFEDEYMLVIDKPAGLIVHPGAGNPHHTLVNALLHYNEDLRSLPRAGIVHRLDKDTTGLLMIAKTQAAYTSLTKQMQSREVHRHYLALVQGQMISGGRLVTYFGRHPKNRLKMAVREFGKEAITEYAVHQSFTDFTLLNVKLFTGRTHQIRVHMAYLNHPVVGDPLYGGRMRIPRDTLDEIRILLEQFKRQALHAYCLSFTHPTTYNKIILHAPLPDDFKTLLKSLESA